MGDIINPNFTSAITGANLAQSDLVRVVDVSTRDAASSRDGGERTITVAELSKAQNQTTDYATDGAIAVASGTAKLTKGSAGAYTLAAPTADQEGTRLVITSGSAYAHVVTSTDKIEDGVTGGAKDTMTFGAFVGATIELLAVNLKWHVVNKNVVTVAAV